MPKYRKLPVVIEAVQYNGPDTSLPEHIRAKVLINHTFGICHIDTREGTLQCEPGDWLIVGVEGEVYPCSDAIFRKTYEEVAE